MSLSPNLKGKWPGTEGKERTAAWNSGLQQAQKVKGQGGARGTSLDSRGSASQPGCCASSGLDQKGKLAEEPCLA